MLPQRYTPPQHTSTQQQTTSKLKSFNRLSEVTIEILHFTLTVMSQRPFEVVVLHKI
jgi:hypothetical protein